MNCSCQNAGWCETLNRQMVGRPYQICSGTSGLSEEKRAAYIAIWMRETAGDGAVVQGPARPCPPPRGPGTELKRLIAELGLTPGSGCGCDAMATQMDTWGAAGCRSHRVEIVAWLHLQREQRGWGATIAAGAWAVASGLALRINPLDWAGSLVDLAVERAEPR